MRPGLLLLLTGLMACETVPPTGPVLQPEVPAAPSVVPGAQDGAAAADGGFDLDAYKDEQAQADGDAPDPVADPEALVAELGAEGVEIPADVAAAVLPPAPLPGPPPPAPGPAPAATSWTPSNAVTLSWGLRLVSTMNQATPPRAILGLPDGSEEVVRAGDMLPEQGVLVLAVGHDVVQLGQVQPDGDHVQVESVFLTSMYPGTAGR